MKLAKPYLYIATLIALTATSANLRAQVAIDDFDSTAIAIDMDSTYVETDTLDYDSTLQQADWQPETISYFDTGAAPVDTARAKMLFKAIDKLLPYVRTNYINDTLYRLIATDYSLYGRKIKKITGNGTTVDFKLTGDYALKITRKTSYTFNQAYEYVIEDDVDVIVLVSDDGKAAYMAFCSDKPLCNHLAYLMEFENHEYSIYELDSEDGADVAMFNYTLDNVNRTSGSDIYPIADIQKAPANATTKKKASSSLYTTTMTVTGSILVGGLLILLLLL